MKNTKSLLLALTLAGLSASSTLFASTEAPGVFDIGCFKAAQKGEYVEVNLSPNILSIAARAMGNQDPEVCTLVKELKQIRVNVAKLDDSNREQAAEQIAKVNEALARQNWQSVVKVRENNDKTVDVYVKTRGDEAVEGLVIAVFDKAREAVLVNIVGNIRPEDINKVAVKFDIEPLKKMKFDIHKKHAASAAPTS